MSELNLSDHTGKVLADCLDALEQEETTVQEILAAYPEQKEEILESLALVQRLSSLGQLSPRNEFVKHTRQQIANLPDRSMPLQSWMSQLSKTWSAAFHLRGRAIAAVTAILVVIFVIASEIIYTMAAAGPGDLFYGLKIGLEQAQENLAPNAQVATKIHLIHASNRLEEVQNQLDEEHLENALMALEAYETEIASASEIVRNASDPEQEFLMKIFTNARLEHLNILDALLSQVPESAQGAIQHAIIASSLPADPARSLPKAKPTVVSEPEEPVDDAGPPENLPVPPAVVSPPVEAAPPTSLPIPPEAVPSPAGPEPTDDSPPAVPSPAGPEPTAVPPTVEPGPPTGLPPLPTSVTPPVEPGPPANLPVPPTIPTPPVSLP
jgi:hypothetical protein